ncbi:MAG: hypothetical protein IJ853_00915, partial [Rickettsiales bacterium]|nr:hypothetical protein [Rickettsiales bacterium]
DSGYGTIINTITANCSDGEWSYDTEAKCEVIVNNCSPKMMVKKAGLSKDKYLTETDSTGSRVIGRYVTSTTTALKEEIFVKLYACTSNYAPSGNVVYHCEYSSSTNTYEWQRVSSYATDVTCVPSSCTPAKATEKSGLPLPDYAWVDTSYNNATYGTTSTIGFIEGVYLKLKQCASGYTLTGSLMYQCVKSGDSYEWQSVSGYTDGTCIEDE